MIYECEHCEAVLGPGATACPRCGRPFDEPVPFDATADEGAGPAEGFRLEAPLLEAPTPSARPVRAGRMPRPSRLGLGLAASVLLVGAGWWLGGHSGRESAPATTSVASPDAGQTPSLPTEAVAHPAYPAAMTAFVGKLRATGVGAQWPAFGSRDILVITPPVIVDGQRALWDRETSLRLAQGVYGYFAQTRFDAGFSDTDSTTCFVIVTTPAGQVVAVDLMGNLG